MHSCWNPGLERMEGPYNYFTIMESTHYIILLYYYYSCFDSEDVQHPNYPCALIEGHNMMHTLYTRPKF